MPVIFHIITTTLYKFLACVYVIVTIGTNLNCSEVKISHVSHISCNFITLCIPELKINLLCPYALFC